MNILNSELLCSIQTGFVDKSIRSKHEYRPQLLVNDKKAGRKILSTLEWELKYCDEFWFSVAFVTTGGLATIINRLKELEEKRIPGKILVSQYLNFTQPEALRRLMNFKNIELKIATEGSFHAKGYLFRKQEKYSVSGRAKWWSRAGINSCNAGQRKTGSDMEPVSLGGTIKPDRVRQQPCG